MMRIRVTMDYPVKPGVDAETATAEALRAAETAGFVDTLPLTVVEATDKPRKRATRARKPFVAKAWKPGFVFRAKGREWQVWSEQPYRGVFVIPTDYRPGDPKVWECSVGGSPEPYHYGEGQAYWDAPDVGSWRYRETFGRDLEGVSA